MDMNRIESVTILKDASAKALYGSKAANGVIVVETKRIMSGEQKVTYNGSVTITAPDLSSYNLCNAWEKLEVERLAGLYHGAQNSVDQREEYYEKLRLINDGLYTDWMSKPLQLGVGHKHNISVELGDSKSLRSVLDFTYNNVAGVMKGSDRTNISGSINMSYRHNDVLFRNVMSVTSNMG
jgi:TonB-dependent SusC/RagA subfamily outer membrane receptor